MRRFSFFIALVVMMAPAVAETPAWMNDEQITQAFAGVTIAGSYADGREFTESYAKDGAISYTDHRGTLAGRWSTVNSSFCTLYDGYITGGCFRVTRHSGNCYEFYFSSSSEREAAADGPKRANWTARAWDKGKPPTCDEKPSA